MSARDELRAMAEGVDPPVTSDSLCAALTDLLRLAEKGRAVTGAAVFGRGPEASVDVLLDDGTKLTFERFADVAKPAVLSGYLVTTTGIYRTFKGAEAGAIAAAIHRLAQHHADEGEDDATRDYAEEFLRLAPTLHVDMNDQLERWRAFSTIAADGALHINPEDRSAGAIAARSTVIVDPGSGRRLVRASWFAAYVRAEAGGLHSPGRLAIAVQRIGWTRPNSQGRVKATNPTDRRTLSWAFHVVAGDWEGPQAVQVTASYGSNACVRTRARKGNEPAVTRNLHTDRCKGPDDLADLGPELPDDSLADALRAPRCSCERPLPAPDEDGALRCTDCGHATGSWSR